MAKAPSLSFDGLPSYSESMPNDSLLQRMATARTTRISLLLTEHILPHLLATTLSGLSSSTIVLIPSDASSLQPGSANDGMDLVKEETSFRREVAVSFPDDQHPGLIRLQGQENSFEFWRQPAVIVELAQKLRGHLQMEGHRFIENEAETVIPDPSKSKGFFSNKAPRDDRGPAALKPLGIGDVRTNVELKDVSLRSETEMGLYETITRQAVVVKVDVGV